MKVILNFLLIAAFFTLGAIAYTWPGPLAIWESRTDVFMSDGTDPTASPFHFDVLFRGYQKDPGLFFYGGFPNPQLDGPEGFVSWYSPIEKIAGAILPFFTPVEQVATLLGILLLVANGLSFYALGRILGWGKVLSLALSTAWAFSVYTRTRTQVHAALSGTYIVPLAFLGVTLLMKDRSRKGVILSALCFLGCATAAHYYLIYMAVFLPFLVLYYFSDSEVRTNVKRSLTRALFAAIPAVLFLVVSFLMPAPSEFKDRVAHVLPSTGEAQEWPHPFVTFFSADIKDYFTGDVAIGESDINPFRAKIDNIIRKDVRLGSNFHEHAQGIRWTIWIGFIFAIVYVFKTRKKLSPWQFEKLSIFVFLAFGLFAFLCSLSPDWGLIWGPSAWIHWLVSQIRVPNRAGIFVHFCVLMVLGFVINQWLKSSDLKVKTKNILMGLFFVVVILDFPPFMNEMPMAKIVPSIKSQYQSISENCGLGFHFPYVSGTQDSLRFYTLLQRLRGTDCAVLNSTSPSQRDLKTTTLFGYQNQKFLKLILDNDDRVHSALIEFAKCNKLRWLVFDTRVPGVFIERFCRTWDGTLVSPDFCVSKSPKQDAPIGLPDQCLKNLGMTDSK